MRIFWALVVVLVAAGLGIPALQSMRARSHAELQLVQSQNAKADAESRINAATVPASLAKAEPAVGTPAATPVEIPAAALIPSLAVETPKVEPARVPVAAPVVPPVTLPTVPASTPPSVTPNPPLAAPTAAPPATQAPAAPVSTKPAASVVVTPPVATDAPALKITKKPDGSMVIDDRFTVKGSGTIEDPYQLSWDLLTSISESYDPRVGKKKLPERLTMFDGKFVRLTGYIAFPMFVEQPRELLSMLNQWDGCCIGVPPTPYDAVEVHLKEAVTKDQRLATYGSIEGKFGVKPYLAGDWLVGLYIMDDAKVSAKEVSASGS